MSRGGRREGAGRKPGIPNTKTQDRIAAIEQSGLTPLDYMLAELRNDKNTAEVRMDAAKAAAPYVHARLAAVEHSGGLSLTHEDALDELDEPGTDDQAQA